MDKDKLEKNHNCDNVNCNHNNTKGLCCLFNPENCKYRQLQKENAELKEQNNHLYNDLTMTEAENAELKADNDARKFAMAMSEKVEKQLREENEDLKVKVGLSIDCEKAQKDGELCLGYGGDEDEPCERCKNCIKCECGYYQLGETEKDEQLTKAKEIISEWEDSFCCGADYLYLGNKGKELRIKSQKFLNS